MFGLGRSKQLIGMDIGSSSVKVVELRQSGKDIEVTKVGVEPLAPEIVVDGAIVDTGQVSNSIAKIFTENKIKTKYVATAVSGHSVIVKKLSLQPMTDEELDGAIPMEAAQHIPFDIAEVNLDYQVLESPADSPTMEVLLVAVKKDKILNYTNVITLAGRTPVIVDIDAFALQNVYEYNYEPSRCDRGAAQPGRQRHEHQHRARPDAPVYARCLGGRQSIHRLAAEGTRPGI